MLGYTFQTGDSGDKPRSQEESKKEVSSKGNQSCYEEGASALRVYCLYRISMFLRSSILISMFLTVISMVLIY